MIRLTMAHSVWPAGATFIWWQGMWREDKLCIVGISKEMMQFLIDKKIAIEL